MVKYMNNLNFVKNNLIKKVLLIAHQVKSYSEILLDSLNNIDSKNIPSLKTKKELYYKKLTKIKNDTDDIINKIELLKGIANFNLENFEDLIKSCEIITDSYQEFYLLNRELFTSNYIVDINGNINKKENI